VSLWSAAWTGEGAGSVAIAGPLTDGGKPPHGVRIAAVGGLTVQQGRSAVAVAGLLADVGQLPESVFVAQIGA
jgi:hypothetical protein